MSLATCVFWVRVADPALRPVVERRVDRVRRFYEGVDVCRLRSVWIAGDTLVGEVAVTPVDAALTVPPRDLDAQAGVLAWGADPGALTPAGIVNADNLTLRDLPGPSAVIAWDHGVSLIAGGWGATSLYRAASDGVEVHASHAAAAAILAHDHPRVDGSQIADLAVCGFMVGSGVPIAGVTAHPLSTVLRSGAGPVVRSTSWSARERWQPVDPDEAYALTERALLDHLSRVAADGSVDVGLTAGLDSAVVLAALRHLGVPARTLTWGDEAWPDVAGARANALALGFPHRMVPIEPLTSEAALSEMRGAARWTDGMAALTPFGRIAHDRRVDLLLTGAGGETGRAFYYRWEARNRPRPTVQQVVACLRFDAHFLSRCSTDALDGTHRRISGGLEEAAVTGRSGWQVADVFYSEQRGARWGRSVLPRTSGRLVGAFSHPDVQRGLASLPLADRTGDGFHRRFLAAHAPAVLPTTTSTSQRAHVPAVVRRLVAGRRRRHVDFGDQRWPLANAWVGHTALKEWLIDEALATPPITQGLGDHGVRELCRRVSVDDAEGTRSALSLIGVQLLDAAFDDLTNA